MFSLNHRFFYWSPEGPLKVPCRSRMLGPLGDLQGTSLGRRAPVGLIVLFCVILKQPMSLLVTEENIEITSRELNLSRTS